jgi:hypothetical protein
MMAKKDDFDMYGGGGGGGGGKGGKKGKKGQGQGQGVVSDGAGSSAATASAVSTVGLVDVPYVQCSAYANAPLSGAGTGTGGEESAFNDSRAYWVCQMCVKSICLITNRTAYVPCVQGLPTCPPSDAIHTALKPLVSVLTSIEEGTLR